VGATAGQIAIGTKKHLEWKESAQRSFEPRREVAFRHGSGRNVAQRAQPAADVQIRIRADAAVPHRPKAFRTSKAFANKIVHRSSSPAISQRLQHEKTLPRTRAEPQRSSWRHPVVKTQETKSFRKTRGACLTA
jgi:hypothetical protein